MALSLVLCSNLAFANLDLESRNNAAPVATADQYMLSAYTFTQSATPGTQSATPGTQNVTSALVPTSTAEPSTRVTLISSQGGAADTATTTGLTISQGSILDSGDASPWPSERYEQSVQTVVNTGTDVTAIVTQVPVPASLLLVAAGLGLVGFTRSRYASVR